MATKEEIEANIVKRKIEGMKRRKTQEIRRRLRWANQFIDCGETDIKASKVLFNAKLFSLSIYHLQQAVEKLAKADYLLFSYWQEKIEKIEGHNSTEKVIATMKSVSMGHELIFNDNSITSEDLDVHISNIKEMNKKNNFSSFTEAQILSFIEAFDLSILIGELAIDNFFFHYINNVKSFEIIRERWNTRQIMQETGNIAQTIQFGSALTDSHFSTTRYPNLHMDGGLSPSDYTEEMGIVKTAPLLIDRLLMIVTMLRHLSTSIETYLEAVLNSLTIPPSPVEYCLSRPASLPPGDL
jgi:hypothetical protein